MHEFTVEYSNFRRDGCRVSFEILTGTVYAENKDEVMAIMAEEVPGAKVHKITRGERADDVMGLGHD